MLMLGKPEVPRVIPRDGIYFTFANAICRNEPAIVEISQSESRERPDSPAMILEQRLDRIVRQST
jgi:hypothetical protein